MDKKLKKVAEPVKAEAKKEGKEMKGLLKADKKQDAKMMKKGKC